MIRLVLVPLVLFLVLAAPAQADGLPERDGNATVEIVAEHDLLRPGRSTTIGVVIVPDEGWHTYWQNPGDAGAAPEVEWILPAGLEVGVLEWPAPTRHVEAGLVSFVYEGDVVLPATLHVAADAPEGDVVVRAKVKWVVCHDRCVPGEAEVSLRRRIGTGLANLDKRAHHLLSAARDALPQPGLGAEVFYAPEDGGRLLLQFDRDLPLPYAFFPETQIGLDHRGAIGMRDKAGQRLLLPFQAGKSPPQRVDGVFTAGEGEKRLAFAVHSPVVRDGVPPVEPPEGSGLVTGLIFLGVGILVFFAVALFISSRRTHRS